MIDFEGIFNSPNPEQAIAHLVGISLTDLDSSLANHASLFAYAETIYSLEKSRESRCEVEVKRAKATAMKELTGSGTTATAAAVLLDIQPHVVAATNNLLNQSARTEIVRALVDSFIHRKEMLVMIASRTRPGRGAP